jgi:cysteine desulfurase/selenocysteine lyase
MVDAAQSAPYQKIDVKTLDCDFLALSGHKMLAPTGIGALYIKKDLHEEMPPYQVGGGMIFEVTFEGATWQRVPARLEAGTPSIAQAVGLGAAVDYYNAHVDWQKLRAHQSALCTRLIEGLQKFPTVTIVGFPEELKKRGHLVSFEVEGLHAHDVAGYLDTHAICMRAGHHCAQPLARKLGIEASCRASFNFYNTLEEVDRVLEALATMHRELLGIG